MTPFALGLLYTHTHMGKLATLKPRVQPQDSRLATLGDSWRTDKRGSTARGYGYAWQQRRAAHLRAHPLCVYCLRENRVTAATVADHITPHHGNAALFAGPLQSLCAPCHSSVKAKEEGRGG